VRKNDDFVVNLTCPVPRCEKRLKQTCISSERSKYSKCVEVLVEYDCTHTNSADLLRGIGINSAVFETEIY